MRLLHIKSDGEIGFSEYPGKDVPPYGILSHTWLEDHHEVTFKDIKKGRGKEKLGYMKIIFCRDRAGRDGLRYFWVDTCCIDKSSSAELQESINSMYRWYQNADKCYVLLTDVSAFQPNWTQTFRDSRWFTRGWTLQELLAAKVVEFFSYEGERLGDRGLMAHAISCITNIDVKALQQAPLSQFTVEERLSWAQDRQTKREEDAAYSLLGIFDIQIPLLYGEGREKALARLLREIKSSAPTMMGNEEHSQTEDSYILPRSTPAMYTADYSIPGHRFTSVISVDFLDDSTKVASVGATDKTAKIWDSRTGYFLQKFSYDDRNVRAVMISPDARRLASVMYDYTIKTWKVEDRKRMSLRQLIGHAKPITSMVFSSDSIKMASGSKDTIIKVWDASSGQAVQTLDGHRAAVSTLVFSSDSSNLASGSMDRSVKIWDVIRGEYLRTLNGHKKEVSSVAFSLDSTRIISGSYDQDVKIWDTQSGKCLRTFTGHSDWVSSVSFGDQSRLIASAGGDDTIRIWDVRVGECLQVIRLGPENKSVYSLAFSHDGSMLVSGSGNGQVGIWKRTQSSTQSH